jgi:hypothetical protein
MQSFSRLWFFFDDLLLQKVKLVIFVPVANADAIREALAQAEAGREYHFNTQLRNIKHVL